MLNALSGSLDGFRDVPDDGLPRSQWYEALLQAEGIVNRALTQIAVGQTPGQAAGWLEEKDAVGAGMETLGTGGTIELVGPDVMETDRTLTVAIGVDRLRTPAVTASRGPAPEPRPRAPATLLRTWHHLNQLAAVLGELVLEPQSDGIPLCGSDGAEVTCESCGRTADGDTARAVEAGPPSYRRILVCSVPCARAASADGHSE